MSAMEELESNFVRTRWNQGKTFEAHVIPASSWPSNSWIQETCSCFPLTPRLKLAVVGRFALEGAQ